MSNVVKEIEGLGNVSIGKSKRSGVEFEGFLTSNPKRIFFSNISEDDVISLIANDDDNGDSIEFFQNYVLVDNSNTILDTKSMSRSQLAEEQDFIDSYRVSRARYILASEYVAQVEEVMVEGIKEVDAELESRLSNDYY